MAVLNPFLGNLSPDAWVDRCLGVLLAAIFSSFGSRRRGGRIDWFNGRDEDREVMTLTWMAARCQDLPCPGAQGYPLLASGRKSLSTLQTTTVVAVVTYEEPFLSNLEPRDCTLDSLILHLLAVIQMCRLQGIDFGLLSQSSCLLRDSGRFLEDP